MNLKHKILTIKNKEWLAIDSLLGLISLLCVFINKDGSLNILLAVLLLCFGALSVYKTRKNTALFIVNCIILYYNYSICMANYFYVYKTMFTGYAGTEIGNEGLKVLTLFSLLFYLVMSVISKRITVNGKVNIITNNKNNPLFVYVLCILLCIIWVYGFGRPTEEGQRGSPSALFEYSLIFIILGFYYSGKNKLFHIILAIIVVAYAALNFVYGGRATGVQMLLCLVLCTVYDFIPRKWIYIGGIAVFVLMMMIGSMRANFHFTVEALISTLNGISNNKMVSDTAYSSYFTSLTMIDMLSLCTWSDRLHYFGRYLLSILFGSVISDSNLPVITRRYFVHYYGGVLPFYFRFYLGYAGLLVFAGYLYWLFHSMVIKCKHDNGLWRCIAIYVASTAFRWYVYSPSQITRGIMLLSIMYAILYQIDHLRSRS